MSIDISSPKITWAALYVVAGLVFSSGIAWNTILNNSKTATTQWRYINKNTQKIEEQDRYVSQIQSISENLAESSKANRLLSEAMIKLSASVDAGNKRSIREDKEREKADLFMMNLSKQVNNIEVKVGRIEASLSK